MSTWGYVYIVLVAVAGILFGYWHVRTEVYVAQQSADIMHRMYALWLKANETNRALIVDAFVVDVHTSRLRHYWPAMLKAWRDHHADDWSSPERGAFVLKIEAHLKRTA